MGVCIVYSGEVLLSILYIFSQFYTSFLSIVVMKGIAFLIYMAIHYLEKYAFGDVSQCLLKTKAIMTFGA